MTQVSENIPKKKKPALFGYQYLELPEWDDKNMRPKSKMLNCPNCEEDELGMLYEGEAICYKCNSKFIQSPVIRNARDRWA